MTGSTPGWKQLRSNACFGILKHGWNFVSGRHDQRTNAWLYWMREVRSWSDQLALLGRLFVPATGSQDSISTILHPFLPILSLSYLPTRVSLGTYLLCTANHLLLRIHTFYPLQANKIKHWCRVTLRGILEEHQTEKRQGFYDDLLTLCLRLIAQGVQESSYSTIQYCTQWLCATV